MIFNILLAIFVVLVFLYSSIPPPLALLRSTFLAKSCPLVSQFGKIKITKLCCN